MVFLSFVGVGVGAGAGAGRGVGAGAGRGVGAGRGATGAFNGSDLIEIIRSPDFPPKRPGRPFPVSTTWCFPQDFGLISTAMLFCLTKLLAKSAAPVIGITSLPPFSASSALIVRSIVMCFPLMGS